MTFSTNRKRTLIACGAIVIVSCAAWGGSRAMSGASYQSTDDAYVVADFTAVAPKVSGIISAVHVEDNQAVKAGDLLATIDDRDFQAALASAKADLAAAQAEVDNFDAEIARQPALVAQAQAGVRSDQAAIAFARANAARYRNLSEGGAGTLQEQQQATSQFDQAQAAMQRDQAVLLAAQQQMGVLQAGRGKAVGALGRAQAAVQQASLNLSYTRIRAPIDGTIGQRSARNGAFVNAGSTMMAVVPLSQAYIVANYQENQLARMQRRQPVTITVDSFPGVTLKGKVDSVAPATEVSFSPIAPDNATGNFTKVVQRVPVKIVLDRGQSKVALLRVGMSVVPTVDIAAHGDGPLRSDVQ
jgi:membrane fusion protein (multidrug efflux system)